MDISELEQCEAANGSQKKRKKSPKDIGKKLNRNENKKYKAKNINDSSR